MISVGGEKHNNFVQVNHNVHVHVHVNFLSNLIL